MHKGALICGFDNTLAIARKVSEINGCDYSGILVKSFPDGESLVSLEKGQDPLGRKVFIVSSMSNPNTDLINTILAGSAAKDHGAKEVVLLATYMPYLRQDKSFHDYESVSAKHVMDSLLSVFDHVLVVDPHLHRIDSLKEYSKKASEVSSISVIIDYLKKVKEDFVIVGPDEESYQWSKSIAKKLGKEVHVLIKNRKDSQHVKTTGENFSLVGKNAVIIDDIISTGHTISESLKLIKSHGAKNITCIGIHGLLNGKAISLITKYAKLITTNTVPSKFSKIDISSLLAEAINAGL